MVLATTNRPEGVDPAILRRLPRHFEIPLPSSPDERRDILRKALRGMLVCPSVNLTSIAAETEG